MTLIALVVTVVVLIILATISINSVFGENGLIKKSEEAKDFHEQAKQEEQARLDNVAEYMGGYLNGYGGENTTEPDNSSKPAIGPNGKPLVNKDTVTTTDHTKIIGEDEKGNQVVIPKGFKVAEDSGTTVQDGIVIEDNEQNQFVWIPVSNINHDGSNKIVKNDGSAVEITLGRYTFARTKNSTTGLYEDGTPTKVQYGSEYAATTAAAAAAGTVSQYKASSYYYELTDSRISNNSSGTAGTNTTAKNLQAFIESVRNNHGYYLARYEASHSVTDNTKPASKIADVWDHVTQPTAAEASRNMYNENTKVEVESDLCNSYGWDTAIVYIQVMGHSNYANANRDTTGNTSPLKTGETGDEKCKIFDMAANCYEWTTEYSTYVNSFNAYSCTFRGGYYSSNNGYTSSRAYKQCNELRRPLFVPRVTLSVASKVLEHRSRGCYLIRQK